MKKSISTLLLIIFFLATAEASNYGQKEGGTAFLDIATGARAAGMGQAQSAVKAENSSAVETNPAALGELKQQSLTASSVALGFDRLVWEEINDVN